MANIIVLSCPISKDNKVYQVGDIFPYSANDKHLLWNLKKIKSKPITLDTSEVPVEATIDPFEVPNVSAKSSKKTSTRKKKNNVK